MFMEINPHDSIIVEAMLKEYEVLRNEIDVYHGHQEKIMMYSLLTLGALFGSLSYVRDNNLSFVFLSFPLLFIIYGYLYADKTVRILRLADYIHNGLRPKLCAYLGINILQWEIYKKECPLFTKDKSIYLDITRWALFIVPGMISLGLYYSYFGGEFNQIFDIILLVIDILLLFLLALFIYNINETKGITSREKVCNKIERADPLNEISK